MIKDDKVLLECWALCPGVPRYHWFNVSTPVFACTVCYHIGLFAALSWIMDWEAPQYVHCIIIAFNNIWLLFSFYDSVFVKGDYAFIVKKVQLKQYWSGGWGIFMHVLPVLINCEVEFRIDEWIKLWINCGVSLWLYFMMDTWCWLQLPGYPDCVLCIMSH